MKADRGPLSLRIARTLCFLAAGFAFAPPFMILALSQEPLGAVPYMALFFLTGGAFVIAAIELVARPARAKKLAVAGALALAALGTITGFSLGMVTFPGAAVGVAAAWAALLHPPRRALVIALLAYLAVGVVVTLGRGGFGFIYAIFTVFIWPIWSLFIPAFSIGVIYAAIGIAATLVVGAFLEGRPFDPQRSRGWIALGIAGGLVLGAVTVAAFVAWAYARPETSARFELAPIVLALVFAGGFLLGTGLATLRSAPSWLPAIGLGLGTAALLLTFTYQPAVTCIAGGGRQGTPLEWALTSFGGSSGSSGSGSSGTIGPGGERTVQSGEFNYGGRRATFRCEGSTVVDYREVP
jgi:hypothetical protein